MPLSQYAQKFDQTSLYWQNNFDMNSIFLRVTQNNCNHRLRVIGHLFLNEVHDMLGLRRTTQGAIVGWMWKGEGDNYVDFCLGEDAPIDPEALSFQLDFNVDGVIYDKIEDQLQ